jgi:hypothetical protein
VTVVRQWLVNKFSQQRTCDATMKELWKRCFRHSPCQGLYTENQWELLGSRECEFAGEIDLSQRSEPTAVVGG